MTVPRPRHPKPAGVAADPIGGATDVPVVVRRSARRQRTVSAHREAERIVVLVPASLTQEEEQHWVREMVSRLQASQQRRRPTDVTLQERAGDLSRRFLGGVPQPSSVTWSSRQQGRWGSATPAQGTIRLSTRLQGMPTWVVDYVLVHELAHLIVPGHGQRFWTLVSRYPRTERARGYLQGVAESKGLDIVDDAPEAGPGADRGADRGAGPGAVDGLDGLGVSDLTPGRAS